MRDSQLDAATTSYSLSGGWTAGATYLWRVIPANAFGDAAGVPEWTFHVREPTSEPPGNFVLKEPTDGVSFAFVDVDLQWSTSAAASTYSVYVWERTPDGSEPDDLEPVAHVGAATAYTAFGLETGKTYSWKVVATNEAGESASQAAVFGIVDSTLRRGDANDDGEVDVSDAVVIVLYLFAGSAAPACLQAADLDDGGVVDISDVVYALEFLFLGRPPPAAPFPACAVDPTADTLGCDASAACAF